jgi:site-specific DNA-methyltransferase (adenine-specific)
MEINKIYNEDNLETMAKMPDSFVDLIVTSPPYNKGYWSSNRNLNNGFKTKARRIDYENYSDNLNPKDYEEWQKKFIKECLRILKPTGSFFYNHQPIQKNHQEVNPLFIYDFPLKQTIIWNRKNTPKLDKSYFFPITEYIFWLQKEKDSRVKFNRKKALFNTNVWNISPDVKNKFPAPFPEELVNNCILSCTEENDLVYDPFMGSGTTAKMTILNNRNWIGSEISTEYCEIINKRLESILQKKNKQDEQ